MRLKKTKKSEFGVHWLVIFLVHVKIMRRWGYCCLQTQTHYFVITIWETNFHTNMIMPKAQRQVICKKRKGKSTELLANLFFHVFNLFCNAPFSHRILLVYFTLMGLYAKSISNERVFVNFLKQTHISWKGAYDM